MTILETKREYNKLLKQLADIDQQRSSFSAEALEFISMGYMIMQGKRHRLLNELRHRCYVPEVYAENGFPLGQLGQLRLF